MPLKPKKRAPIGSRKRFRVLQRHGFRCRYCGRPAPDVVLHVDHIISVSAGGTDDEANLVAACKDCNFGKSALSAVLPGVSFLKWLRSQRLRDDVVGDFADDEEHSPLQEPRSYKDLCAQLRVKRAHRREVLQAAWHAWREFRRSGRPTPLVQKMRNHADALIRENAVDDSCLWLKRGFWSEGVFYPYSS